MNNVKSFFNVRFGIILFIFVLGFLLNLILFEEEKLVNENGSRNSIEKYLSISSNEEISPTRRKFFSNKAYNLLSGAANDSLNRTLLLKNAQNFYDFRDSTKFSETIRLLRKYSKQAEDSLSLAMTFQMEGRYNEINYITDSAYYFFNKAQNIYKGLNKPIFLAQNSLDMASLQFAVSDYVNAEQSVFTGLKSIDNKKDFEQLYTAYNLLGTIYCELQEYDKAIDYHQRALNVAKNIENNQYTSISLNNIGNVYQYKKDFKGSLTFYNNALLSKELYNVHPKLYAILQDNLAYSQFKLGNNDHLPQLFYDALKIRDSLNIVPGLIINYIHLSEFYHHKDSLKSKQFAQLAYGLSDHTKLPAEKLLSLKQLLAIDKQNSFYYAQKYIATSDSLQLAERRIRNKFGRIAFETDEIIIEKDTAVRQRRLMGIVAFSILVLGTLLYIITLQRNKQRELLYAHNQQKSNEAIYQLIHDQKIKIEEGRQKEKKRIAQDLHDGVMNRLTSTRLNLFKLTKNRDEETISNCIAYINNIQEIEKEIRQVAHDLNQDIFAANNSFSHILEDLFDEFRTILSAKLSTEIDKTINWELMGSEIKMNFYRVLQEGIHNCNKYADAQNIFVTISKDYKSLHLVITDDGVGFDVKKARNGIGLRNMHDRITKLSGKIDILSERGKGTTIIVNLPLQNNQLNGKENQYCNS